VEIEGGSKSYYNYKEYFHEGINLEEYLLQHNDKERNLFPGSAEEEKF